MRPQAVRGSDRCHGKVLDGKPMGTMVQTGYHYTMDRLLVQRRRPARTRFLRGLGRSLIGALTLLALVAGSAQADETISISVGADPTEEVPVPISVTWSSASSSARSYLTVKPAGSQGCAANYQADYATSSTLISSDPSATGTLSANRTFNDPGDFTLCGYLQDSSSDTTPRKATGPVGVTVRSAKATVAMTVPARVDPGQTFPMAIAVTAELPRRILITVKPAGGRGCEPNYQADSPLSSGVLDDNVQGTQNVQTNVTASTTKATYLLCAYVQEGSEDAVPEATSSAQYLVGPDPCVTARNALTRAEKAVTVAEAAVTRNRQAWKSNAKAATHTRGALRRNHLRLAKRAHSRYMSAIRQRAKARATLAAAQEAVTQACGAAASPS